MKSLFKYGLLCLPLLLAACGTSKNLAKDQGALSGSAGQGNTSSVTAASRANTALKFVQGVSDTKVFAKNIVADMMFTATVGDKTVTAPGQLRMRRDEVIRLQLTVPVVGIEVGRLEFTPDYVLVVDRMHKQYIKGDYNQLDFLKANGLNFYSLQALFWNQLLLPGTDRVGEGDLSKFTVGTDEMGENVPVSLKNGKMTYVWQADRTTHRILQAVVTYLSASKGASTLTWNYDNFSPVGSKQFPALQTFTFTTDMAKKTGKVTVTLKLDTPLRTSDKWDAQTKLSDKYEQMDAKDVLGKLLDMK